MLDPTIIAQTAVHLKPVVNNTPVLTSRSLNRRANGQICLKCENFQRVGAFKFRGAYNAIRQLTSQQRQQGVITHSSGNHAQGVALAAQILGVAATIVMPEDAPAIKRAATAGYGATIVSCSAADRERVAAEVGQAQQLTLIHPYDDDAVIAGQGTAALELLTDFGPLDFLLAPVGGGGLLSGTALAAAAVSPACQVIGVEPEEAADANRSWRDGHIHRLTAVPNTIADGLRPRFIGERNLAIMQRYVADMITVTEDDIRHALAFAWQRLKIVIEPSAATALAPLLTGQLPLASDGSSRVGVILSGGNVDLRLLPALLPLNE